MSTKIEGEPTDGNERRDDRTIPLPLSPRVWGAITLPLPLTEAEWNEMLAVLAVFRPAMVRAADKDVTEPQP